MKEHYNAKGAVSSCEAQFNSCFCQVYYSRKRGKHLAVDRLCLGVPKGEVS